VGKSSLLTHIAQAAATTLEQPTLESLYVDLALLDGAAALYRLVCQALGSAGDSTAALELALVERGDPVLLVLDNGQTAIAAGWGEGALEALARMVRRSRPLEGYEAASLSGDIDLMLVAAVTGSPPQLSEPFASITLGAVAATEVRLLADAYLDDTGVSFAPSELRELWQLSAGHPAYLQRAAFHLFRAKVEPGYDWRAAYRAEVRTMPLPGAPLPPGTFEGDANRARESGYDDSLEAGTRPMPEGFQPVGMGGAFVALIGLALGLLVWRVSGSLLLGAALLAVAIVASVVVQRRLG